MAGGGAFGGDKKGGTVTTETQVPDYLRPFYNDVLRVGQNVSRQPREYFPNSTVVPFSPETEAALAGTTARALGGSPLTNTAQQQQLATIQGGYLDPRSNPAYQSVVDSVTADVLPEAYKSYASGGQFFGSPVETEAVAKGLSRGLAPYTFDQYNRERALQQTSALSSPALAATDYQDLNALLGVGGTREDLNRAYLQEAIDRFNFAQEEPRTRLGEYANLVFGAPVGFNQTTQQTAKGGSVLGGAAGGALSGAATGTMIYPGWGTLIGAVLGGVGGAASA